MRLIMVLPESELVTTESPVSHPILLHYPLAPISHVSWQLMISNLLLFFS